MYLQGHLLINRLFFADHTPINTGHSQKKWLKSCGGLFFMKGALHKLCRLKFGDFWLHVRNQLTFEMETIIDNSKKNSQKLKQDLQPI